MRVLQINNFHHIEGGAERYYFDLSKLLQRNNIDVAYFSVRDEKNETTPWSQYFLDPISLDKITLQSFLKLFERMIYSREAKIKINKIIDKFKPDIVHIHNIDLFISPSILPEIKKRSIPIIHTLHDYHLIAPTRGCMFHNNQICEITKPHKYYKAILHKCVRNSYLASTAFVIKQYIHDAFSFYNNIDVFIAPSIFLKKKYIEYGFDSNKIIHIPNFIDNNQYLSNHNSINNKYILFFGRLSSEKGLITLLNTMKYLSNIKLIIAGSGSQYKELVNLKNRLNLQNVKFIGYKHKSYLFKLISGSRFTILPSLWYEVSGISILESFACSKPVIASKIGGIPEVITSGYNGLLFTPGDIDDCLRKIKILWDDQCYSQELGINGIKTLQNTFSPTQHYKKLMQIYTLLLQ